MKNDNMNNKKGADSQMISVISPCYNVEAYVARFIDSVLAQTYPFWELILIDDGSTDKTGIICDEYAKKDHRIRVIHKQNEGVSEARNKGLEISIGEYIVFWDPDDWVEPDLLKFFFDACIRIKCDMAACDILYVSQDESGFLAKIPGCKWGDLQKEKKVTDKEMYYSIFIKSATLFNKLFTAKKINSIRFDQEKHYGEDTDFLLRAMQHMQSAVLLPYIGYNYYYKRPGNVVSASIDNRSLELIDNSKKIYESMKEIGLTALGVFRIHVAVMEVMRKIPVEMLGNTEMKKYIDACGIAVRYPAFTDIMKFVADRHFKLIDKSRYIMNYISPRFRTVWKKTKNFLYGN